MRYLKQFILTTILFLTGSISFAQDNLPVSGQIAGHDYIDLGLPSGTLWATYNVGATKPEQYGYYFAWGETEPKEVYGWSTYKWGDDEMTKYYDGGGLMTLLPEDDAATANWGSKWRMPTNEEQRELVDECQYQMTEVNDVYGVKFTGKNGNSVFFPAAGFRNGSDVDSEENYGYYWSSSLHEEAELAARYLDFSVDYVRWNSGIYRSNGFNVRAVRAQK